MNFFRLICWIKRHKWMVYGLEPGYSIDDKGIKTIIEISIVRGTYEQCDRCKLKKEFDWK